jgi:hypothetical protein
VHPENSSDAAPGVSVALCPTSAPSLQTTGAWNAKSDYSLFGTTFLENRFTAFEAMLYQSSLYRADLAFFQHFRGKFSSKSRKKPDHHAL